MRIEAKCDGYTLLDVPLSQLILSHIISGNIVALNLPFDIYVDGKFIEKVEPDDDSDSGSN